MKKGIVVSAVVLLVGSVAFGVGNISQFQDWTGIIGTPGPVPPTVQWNGIGSALSNQTITWSDKDQHETTPYGTSANQTTTPVLVGSASATGTGAGAVLTADIDVSTSGLDLNGNPGNTAVAPPLGSGQEQNVSYAAGTVVQFEGFGASGNQALNRNSGTGWATATNTLYVPTSQDAANTPVGAGTTQSALLDRPGTGTLPAQQTALVDGQPGNVGNATSGLNVAGLQAQSTIGSAGAVAESQVYTVGANQHVDTAGNTGTATTATDARLNVDQSDAHNVGATANEQAVVTASQSATVTATAPGGSGQVNNTLTADGIQIQQVN